MTVTECEQKDCKKEAINHFKIPSWDLELVLCDEHFIQVMDAYHEVMDEDL